MFRYRYIYELFQLIYYFYLCEIHFIRSNGISMGDYNIVICDRYIVLYTIITMILESLFYLNFKQSQFYTMIHNPSEKYTLYAIYMDFNYFRIRLQHLRVFAPQNRLPSGLLFNVLPIPLLSNYKFTYKYIYIDFNSYTE